jgi:hypothetical protein
MLMTNEPVGFSINLVGDFSGNTWVGDFKTKPRLSYRDQLRKDQIRRELLGGERTEQASEDAMSFANLFSSLAVRLTETPTWWKEMNGGIDLLDENVVLEVWKKTMEIAKKANDEMASKADSAKKALQAINPEKK